MEKTNGNCIFCDSGSIREAQDFMALLRVTSDSKIWPAGGRIGQCVSCGAVQKIATDALAAEINHIYSHYTLYFQGQGEEQKIFNHGIGRPRSECLLEYFVKTVGMENLKDKQDWLDFGCGTGHFLRTLSASQLGLKLYGSDLSEANRNHIESIENVYGYYAGMENIDKKFNFLSLSHVLEHIPTPKTFLQSLKKYLTTDGYLLIAVPNWQRNPFDLLVTDHYLHFTANHLANMVTKAGFEVIAVDENILIKELILIAKPTESQQQPKETTVSLTENQEILSLENEISWLKSLVSWANQHVKDDDTGLLGTALTATWLDSSCQSAFSFFSDEDPFRQNTTYLNRPVFSPKKVPMGAKVLVPLEKKLALQISTRLNQLGRGVYYAPQQSMPD